MPVAPGLVSIGLPVRNGADRIGRVIAAVLAQDFENLELVISDNASDDHTEEFCREIAATDPRIRYHRQDRDLGIHGNFDALLRLARGELFRWIGDDDTLEPTYVSRCTELFAARPQLILVTTRQDYLEPDGEVRTGHYDGSGLGSADPVVRLTEMLRLLTESHLVLDPVYGLMCRSAALAVPPRRMLRQDELFATRMALEGPWGHVPEILAHRHWSGEQYSVLTRRLGLPSWYARVINLMQLKELLRDIDGVDLTPGQRAQARRVAFQWYGRWHRLRATHRMNRILGAVRHAGVHTPVG